MNSSNFYDEEIQESRALRTPSPDSAYEVLCKSQEVPKIIRSRDARFHGMVILHPSKHELVISGHGRGVGGQTLEVVYGGDVVKVPGK